MNRSHEEILWLIVTGAILGGNDRDELFEMLQGSQAPTEIAALLRAVKAKDGHAVRVWFAERQLHVGESETCVVAAAKHLAAKSRVRKAKQGLMKLSAKLSGDQVDKVETLLEELLSKESE